MPTLTGAPRPPCRPALQDKRLDFIAEAERFAAACRGLFAFRLLRWITRADDDEVDALAAKMYCDALPQAMGEFEGPPASLAKGLLLPLKLLFAKKWLWRPEKRALYDLEVDDAVHLEHSFSRVYAALPEPKRLVFAHRTLESVRLSTGLKLFLAPLALPQLWLLSRRLGLNLLEPYRRALGTYAGFEARFRRFPCQDFCSYDDVLNHPARHIAFRQNSGGRLFVVQNGLRGYHPSHAFGRVSVYLSFGEYMARLAPELRIHAPRVVPVGCLNLDRRHALLEELRRGPQEPLYDVTLIDQGLWPRNGLDRRTGLVGFDLMFRNLNELKRRQPRLRVAVQLRGYAPGSPAERDLRAAHESRFTEPIEILANDGRGGSYRTLYRSRLAICYNSTLGWETFLLGPGRKALYVNHAGHPFAVYSWDPRFQLYDEGGDADAFERKVLELLCLELAEPPEVAREQICAADGKTQERIAAALLAERPQ